MGESEGVEYFYVAAGSLVVEVDFLGFEGGGFGGGVGSVVVPDDAVEVDLSFPPLIIAAAAHLGA